MGAHPEPLLPDDGPDTRQAGTYLGILPPGPSLGHGMGGQRHQLSGQSVELQALPFQEPQDPQRVVEVAHGRASDESKPGLPIRETGHVGDAHVAGRRAVSLRQADGDEAQSHGHGAR